ncbi:NAD-dependent histone deacetylase sir2 [Vermiconidia calcicola]|uniref:NAD-dependent histone deacetylase sir2 n=1 Tax=Vermiconidia calcicola TaxID=1690605 RepID=A0ACC3MIT6_9PEZI|nr:NAD-dependent histone deacetylase sir2 [Vermiconidia calcicola]
MSTKVATPLAHRKRRHSAIDRSAIDLTGSDDSKHSGHKTATNGAVAASGNISDVAPRAENGTSSHATRKLEDENDDSGEGESEYEDIVDAAELEPWRPLIEGEGVDSQTASRLRSTLLHVGPEKFLHDALTAAAIPPYILGTAFGLDPALFDQLGENRYMHVLGQIVVRSYYKRRKLPQYNTIDDVAALLRNSKNIMVITGAGISTSLGIPDFRSKTTGFYSKLLERGINEPEEVFDIHEFDYDPRTFYQLAADLLPDHKHYSPTHGFIRLLQDKGKLQTNYTQNIDNLEELAGIDKHRLIQCHGSFAGATCRKCGHKVKGTEIFPDVRAKRVSRCQRCKADIAAQAAAPKAKKAKKRTPTPYGGRSDSDDDDDIPEPGVMKPDITFFGEQLPEDFFDRFTERDVKTIDLVLVIGTSLKVAPVSEMPDFIPHHVPHIFISREPIEHVNFDVQLLGNCDDVVFELCRRAGWELKHRMVPKGLEVSVEAVEDFGSRWRVKRRPREDGKVDGRP